MSAPTPVVPVILSGGFGTRLWPASRKRQPKHLLPLREERTMFRLTVERTRGLAGVAAPLVACNEDHRPGIQRDLHRAGYDDATIILEPVGRNTAPAVGDRRPPPGRSATARRCCWCCPPTTSSPTRRPSPAPSAWPSPRRSRGTWSPSASSPPSPPPATATSAPGTASARRCGRWPASWRSRSGAVAARFLRSGGYLWNSGMFVFSAAGAASRSWAATPPTVLAACRQALDGAERRNGLILLDEAAFAARARPSPSTTRSWRRPHRAAVVGLDAGWSDVGDWAALWDLADHDADGNAIAGDVIALGVRHSLLRSSSRLVGVIGLDDVVVVETGDAVLVAARDHAQEVKALVERLQAEGRPEFESDGTDWHTWGTSATVFREAGLLVRRVTVDPGNEAPFGAHGTLHCIVTRGRARLTVGHSVRTLTAGDAARVPAGASARLTNLGTGPLELVLVQLEGADG